MNSATPLHLGPNTSDIAQAANVLGNGGLVILPTETVYGLGADASNGTAVAQVFAAKGRPNFNPLIAHVSDIEMAKTIALFDPLSEKLVEAFWPGPLSLVLPLAPNAAISELATAGLKTVALRMPDHPVVQAVLKELGKPIAAPSANISGRLSPTAADHIDPKLLSKVDAIADGGPCGVGLESTIVMIRDGNPYLLREGGVSREALEDALQITLVAETAADKPTSPGQLLAHYAPKTKLQRNVPNKSADVIHIGFGNMPCDLNLSESGDVIEAAANLFGYLHKADRLAQKNHADTITVAPIPMCGIGRAINDRLLRAARE
ncbi:MAG: L-threonylcarbamoyladenylate synthase [Pseudomonadota bacterium]